MKCIYKSIGLVAGLIVLTFVVYIPAMRGGFIWDDDVYVTDNPMIKASDGLSRFWFTTEAINYYPLTSSLWWLEWRIWGASPTGYHVINLLLHAANAVLVWIVLQQLRIPGAWLAALVFAIHPVNVATVAWISELKNTLSMFFYAITILLYLRFDEEDRWGWYCLSLTTFLLALLSKTATAMLPIVLLGCLWWRHGRVRRKDLLRDLPFFALSFFLGIVTIWFEHYRVLEKQPVRMEGFLARLAVAGCAPWFYLSKALLPCDLSVIYPKWTLNAWAWLSFLPGALLVGCFVLFWLKRRTWGRPLFFGIGYFVVALFPVLGFIDMGFHQYSLVADHWQYHGIIGAIALAIAAGLAIYRRIGEWGRTVLTLASVGLLIGLAAATWTRASVFAQSETLWQDTVVRNPKVWVAHYNLGNAYFEDGRIEDAIQQYTQAVQIDAGHQQVHNNLAFLLLQTGKGREAIAHLKQAIRINPNSPETHLNLGLALAGQGATDEAIPQIEAALRLNPNYAEAHNALGKALAQKGRLPEAAAQFEQAIHLQPDFADARAQLKQVRQELARLRQLRIPN